MHGRNWRRRKEARALFVKNSEGSLKVKLKRALAFVLPRLDSELQVVTIMTRRGSLMPWLRKEFNEQKGSGSGRRI